uniref:Uncharacterized protein n=1 Tax=Strongyloides papillosus TaxID=174720 RepID=A0A0N5B4M9_STREA
MECNKNSLHVGKIPLSEASGIIDKILDQLLNHDVILSDYKINFSINIGKYGDPKKQYSPMENCSNEKKQISTKKSVNRNSKRDSLNNSKRSLLKSEEIRNRCLICTKGNTVDKREKTSSCIHNSTCSPTEIINDCGY